MKRLTDLEASERERPAIFSAAREFAFVREVAGADVGRWLSEFVRRVAAWAAEHGHYVGHVKLFAEAEGGATWWIASTGSNVTLRTGEAAASCVTRRCAVDVTAIVFGAEATALERTAGALLDELAPGT